METEEAHLGTDEVVADVHEECIARHFPLCDDSGLVQHLLVEDNSALGIYPVANLQRENEFGNGS